MAGAAQRDDGGIDLHGLDLLDPRLQRRGHVVPGPGAHDEGARARSDQEVREPVVRVRDLGLRIEVRAGRQAVVAQLDHDLESRVVDLDEGAAGRRPAG